MSKESLDCADKIIMDAYENGMSTMNVKDNKVVQHRLMIFGEWINGEYYLNERGFDYASNGCLNGIIARQVKDEYILDLNIEATKKAMNDADRAFIQSEKSLMESKVSNTLARWALGVSILAILVQFLEEQVKELFSLLLQLLEKGLKVVA